MSPNIKLPHAPKQNQLSQALILQGYCQTILHQQRLNLDQLGNVSNAAEIKSIAKQLDETLGRAQDRMGELEELAGTAVYLASDASRFVNGATLRVDGGYLASGI